MPIGYRRASVVAVIVLAVYILAVTHFGIASPTFSSFDPGAYMGGSQNNDLHEYDKSKAVLGPPSSRFRDNLRNDTYYLTSWASAGFTNQFMSHVNMIYLGLLSNRVPIIAPFAPSHIDIDAGMLSFGDVYDLDYLRKKLHISILEWKDVKILPSLNDLNPAPEVEGIGCWGGLAENKKGVPEPTRLVRYLGADSSYTRLPISVRLPSNDLQNQIFMVFAQLAAVIFPDNPLVHADKLKALQPSNVEHHNKTPDTHLVCFDSLYFTSSGARAFEWEHSWSPAWQSVGRHLPYTQQMKQLGQEYVRRALGVEGSREEIPPFIAVHIRHGDFGRRCPEMAGTCFQPISAYVQHVDTIKKKWLEKSNIAVGNVIVMSDEESPDFWNNIKYLGWSFTNHTKEATAERLGEWYPVIIDTVVQSLAVGHVGTTSSTFTLVGARRVHDWNDGFISDLRSWVST